MKRFLVDPAPAGPGRWMLQGPEAHHARDVLRLGPGMEILLVDGRGLEFSALIVALGRDGLELEVSPPRTVGTEPTLDLTLGLALLKADHMEEVVRQGTQLGLTGLIPVLTARTEVRPDPARMPARLDRWREISRQAVKQCRRGRPIGIGPLMDLTGFLTWAGPARIKVMPHVGALRPLTRELFSSLGSEAIRGPAAALVGPEGGLTPEEAAQAQAAGFVAVGLGPRILRAETAALAVATLMGFLWGDLG